MCGDDMTRLMAVALQTLDFQTPIGNTTVMVGYNETTNYISCAVN